MLVNLKKVMKLVLLHILLCECKQFTKINTKNSPTSVSLDPTADLHAYSDSWLSNQIYQPATVRPSSKFLNPPFFEGAVYYLTPN